MRAQELDVVVVGGANTDFLIRGPSLPGPGRSVEGDTFQQAPGGKGANQAVGAARLEATVALIARIGQDARGDAILSRLADERVDAKAVLRDAEAETGAVLVMVDASGEKRESSGFLISTCGRSIRRAPATHSPPPSRSASRRERT